MDKKVTLKLVGLDGNAFSIMGAFKKQAYKEGWTKEEIDSVLKEAMSGDYDHLLATIMDHCEDVCGDDEDIEDEFEDDDIDEEIEDDEEYEREED